MPKKPYEINLPETPKYGGRMPTLHHYTSAYTPKQALSQILETYGCRYLNDELVTYWHSHPGMIIERTRVQSSPQAGIQERSDLQAGWMYLENASARKNKEDIEAETRKPGHGTAGKYMFFSDDKKLLIELGKKILSEYDLFSAKIPLSDVPKPSPGFGFVLCVYDSSPIFKRKLRQFADEKTVRYRYWKAESATLDGKYSREFLASQNAHPNKARNPMTRGKIKPTRDTEAWNEAARKAQESGDWTRFQEYVMGKRKKR